ncbi:hypothetical protein EUX98_g3759 [Antrodiella citrinella]|uniref:Transcriptional coactivator p15 (PC4) C-terminal domain-containing protein n=1 Tax=Antrodiella citrinella TaxID=2447956 RepID=A0A4S4MXT6_9APHY|nr:hypothetical protein EUX98_g3759 [Antrodiella citrinella]
MGKRRASKGDNDDELEYDDEGNKSPSEQEQSEEEVPIKKSRPKQKDKQMATKSSQRTVKKPKLNTPPREDEKDDEDEDDSLVKFDSDGRRFIDLGKKKRATLSEFKGTVYLDIREFYEKDGEAKPGKKGISISKEQWDILKSNAATIDTLFTKAKKK